MKSKDEQDPKAKAEADARAAETDEGAGDSNEAATTEEIELEEELAPEETPVERPAPESGGGSEASEFSESIKRILDIQLPVTVSFGSTHRPLGEVLKMAPGSLIELDTTAEEPVVLKVNDRIFAWGKVVDVDGYYGVEITEIVGQADRIASVGGH